MSLKSQLESLLFVSIKAVSLKDLASACQAKPKEVATVLDDLKNDYLKDERGLILINQNNQYQITTKPNNAKLVKEFLKNETSGELSQPSLEALTIIAYRGPISKLELDRIRGVNCSLIIRNLLLRGLIEEKFDKDKNENYYTISLDFVRFLGIHNISELPDYQKLNQLETLQSVMNDKGDSN